MLKTLLLSTRRNIMQQSCKKLNADLLLMRSSSLASENVATNVTVHNTVRNITEEAVVVAHVDNIACSDAEGCNTNVDIIQTFVQQSTSDQDLEVIHQALRARIKLFSYLELYNLVEVLCHRMDLTEDYGDPKVFKFGSEIIELVRSECIERLSLNHGNFRFIHLGNHNFENVLKLCHLWVQMDQGKTKQTFTWHVINKIGHSAQNSMRRFKHFTKDGFVSFCILMKHVNLQPDFHKYYCTVKFIDLLPLMNQTEIAQICHTFVSQKITHSVEHPTEIQLRRLIMNFIIEKRGEISSDNLTKMCDFISLNISHCLTGDMKNLQEVFFAENLMRKFDLKAKLALATPTGKYFVFRRGGVSTDYMDSFMEAMLAADQDSFQQLSTKEMCNLCMLVALQRDTPAGRCVVHRLSSIVKHRLTQQHDVYRSGLMFTLHMAQLGLYDHQLITALFGHPLVTVQTSDGGRTMSRPLKFGLQDREGKRNNNMGGSLLQLQGMMDLEFPEYEGLKITEDLMDCQRLHAHSHMPLQVRNGGKETDKLLDRLWVSKGLELYDVMCEEVGGDEYVWETYVLPYTGSVCYVLQLGVDGVARRVGEKVREKELLEVKILEEGMKVEGIWAVFYMLQPGGSKIELQSGGEVVNNRLLSKMGYKGVGINMSAWTRMENRQRREMIRMKILKCSS